MLKDSEYQRARKRLWRRQSGRIGETGEHGQSPNRRGTKEMSSGTDEKVKWVRGKDGCQWCSEEIRSVVK